MQWVRRSFGTTTKVNLRASVSSSCCCCLFMSPSLWPEPNASAAGVRTTALLHYFGQQQQQQWFDSVHYAGPPTERRRRRWLPEHVIPHELPINRTDPIRSLLLEQVKPDVIIFDRFFAEEAYSFQIQKYVPHALRVLDMQDFHSLRHARHQLLLTQQKQQQQQQGDSIDDDNEDRWFHDIMECKPNIIDNDILKRELASIHRSDLILVCSQPELQLLHEEYGVDKDKMVLAPFFCDSSSTSSSLSQQALEERTVDFVTIGGFRHGPNVDAVLWLSKEIWPKIRHQLPQAQLHVYGAYVNSKIQKLHDPTNGFHICGYVEHLSDALSQARVLLAPLRYGAGIKGKIVDAWSHGLPVVTTPIGAEGMMITSTTNNDSPSNDDWGGFIATNVNDFVAHAIHLHSNQDNVWTQKQSNAIKLHQQLFDANRNLKQVRNAIVQCGTNIQTIRKKNIVGNLLWHQSARSTEYFSRWIELKETIPKK